MNSKCYLIPFAALLLFALPALAEVTTLLTLDGVPPDVVCGELWQENQVDLKFVPTTDEDCTIGGCFFGIGPDHVWLYPCRLVVDFVETYNVSRVEINLTDWCGIGCKNAFLYDGAATVAAVSNTTVASLQAVILVPAGGVCDRIGISSCEGQIHEIRIVADIVLDENSAWGSIKALNR
ncbi:hypothetical protein KJ682_12730 [bacterium]|nr:hypothetical protein [bacterium]